MWAWATAALIAATCISSPPRELSLDDKKHFYLKAEYPVILADELMEEEAFAQPLREALGAPPLMSPASLSDRLPDGIFVGTAAHPGAIAKRKFKRYLEGAATLGEEGYRVVVEKDGVVVLGGGVRGAWYGLQALAALSRQYSANLPHLDLRDGPDLSLRGVYLTAMPTDADLEALAALKCTHLFLESDAFYNLTGVQAESWRRVFESARAHYLEPVPVFPTLRGMEKVLREHPLMIEGRAETEKVVLGGSDWVPLRHPNIIAENPETISVSISGVTCIYGKDYTMEAQPLVAPFVPEQPRWRIRREPGGSIPDGAEVELRYSIATEDSSSLCFVAPESRAWLRATLERLITELEPRTIHLDHGDIGRLNQDTRSLGRNLKHAEAYAQSLALIAGLIKEINPKVGLMMWADLLNPGQGAGTYNLEGAQPPEGITRLARVKVQTPREAVDRFNQLLPVASSPMIIAVEGSTAAANTLEQLMVGKNLRGGGMVALSGAPEAAAPVLDAAWSGTARTAIWTRLLNRYFNASLELPDYGAVRSALVRYLNEQTLAGNSPQDIRQRFEAHLASNPDVVASDTAGAEMARGLLGALVDYLVLEERFAQLGQADALTALGELVARVRAGEPQADSTRYEELMQRISGRQQFISARELFQEDLRCYRPARPENPLYELPVHPFMEEATDTIVATLPLMSGHAPVLRIDLEGLGLTSMIVSGAPDGANYEEIQRCAGKGLATAAGAWLLSSPLEQRNLRLTLARAGEGALLRELRLFGEKCPAQLDCGYANIDPPMVATAFDGRPWPTKPQGGAFLQQEKQQFAAVPTSIRVTRTRSDLYIAVEAGTAEPAALVADLTQRDAPLWTQESIEIWLMPAGRLPLRLIASPLGAQYDSEANDAGWDGEWEVVTSKSASGWNALFRIPVALIGAPKRGTNVPLNVVRNHHGSDEERSAWAHAYGAQPELQWGVLRFP